MLPNPQPGDSAPLWRPCRHRIRRLRAANFAVGLLGKRLIAVRRLKHRKVRLALGKLHQFPRRTARRGSSLTWCTLIPERPGVVENHTSNGPHQRRRIADRPSGIRNGGPVPLRLDPLKRLLPQVLHQWLIPLHRRRHRNSAAMLGTPQDALDALNRPGAPP